MRVEENSDISVVEMYRNISKYFVKNTLHKVNVFISFHFRKNQAMNGGGFSRCVDFYN